MADETRLTGMHKRLYELLCMHPEGIDITEIRRELGLSGTEQQHLDRRIRDLRRYYDIPIEWKQGKSVYLLKGPRAVPVQVRPVDRTTRARVLHLSGNRCQMCGRTPAEDLVKLQVDHRVPIEWGGTNDDENLWALCSECNEGKRHFFSSITDQRVRAAMVHSSVHVRIGELLKAFEGEPVPKEYIQIVAYTHDDFEKRMRELRELGWEYHYIKRKEGKRVRTYFVLDNWRDWPDDPAAAIRASEARRRLRRGN